MKTQLRSGSRYNRYLVFYRLSLRKAHLKQKLESVICCVPQETDSDGDTYMQRVY